jgi:hypothetical protein
VSDNGGSKSENPLGNACGIHGLGSQNEKWDRDQYKTIGSKDELLDYDFRIYSSK